jgi:hypothetical protein
MSRKAGKTRAVFLRNRHRFTLRYEKTVAQLKGSNSWPSRPAGALGASVEIDGAEMAERLAAHYLASGWQGPLDTGRAMADVVINGRPDSPERELDVFLACMNRLFKETVAFSVLGQTTQQRGAVRVFTVTVLVGVKR